MGTTILRQFLQSLCHNSPWNYAVFWKLQHQNHMFLTRGDGYSDCPKLIESTSNITIHGENSVGPAVTYMSNTQYAFSERVVDEVAYTGNHLWIFADSILSAELKPTEFPDEWLYQFTAGVKTISLVPVVPHGVLQLGSLETVAEDLALVALIKDKFNTYQSSIEYYVPCMSILTENFDEPESIVMKEMNPDDTKVALDISMTGMIYEDSRAFDCNTTLNSIFLTKNQNTSLCTVENTYCIPGKDMPDVFDGASPNDVNFQSSGLVDLSRPANGTLSAFNSERTESNMLGFTGIDENIRAFPFDVEVLGELEREVLTSLPHGVNNDVDTISPETPISFFNFPPTVCELYKAFGPVFLGHTMDHLWDADGCNSSLVVGDRDLFHSADQSTWESSEWIAEGDDPQHLLEAVIATACGISDDTRSQLVGSALVGENAAPWTQAACGGNAINKFSTSDSSFQTSMSALTEENHQGKRYSYPKPSKGSKPLNSSKRRGRSIDSRKPRPRDRQLIQDRVKELRELVPDGEKCSIDGLLDRTIKHMLFLRSATDQADKLKKWIHLEESVSQNSLNASETMKERGGGGGQSGSSRAYELGSGFEVCPILVKDLEESPGEMLIEMLCDDNGLFLEIAEVICRLKLTVLKGTLKSIADDTWAHFLVKAPRGFHRLDIFWPLMQLLQQNQRDVWWPPFSSRI